jgi:hypothetical protein
MTRQAGPVTGTSILGSCPRCEERIPTEFLLIEYQTSSDWTQMFAECPGCRDVVHPQ